MTAPEPLSKQERATWSRRGGRWLYGPEGSRDYEIGTAFLRYEATVAALESQLSRRETADRDLGSEICPECGELDWSQDGGLAGHSWICDCETTPGRPSDEELEVWAGMLIDNGVMGVMRPAMLDAKRFATYLLRVRRSSSSGTPT